MKVFDVVFWPENPDEMTGKQLEKIGKKVAIKPEKEEEKETDKQG